MTSSVYVDAGQTLQSQNETFLTGATTALYGPGTVNARGSIHYPPPASTALPIANKLLNGVATGYSNATPAPGAITVVHGGIALSSATLDAAAGAAGFGGFAWGGGATYTANGVQP